MARFDFDYKDYEVLYEAMKNYQGNTEEAINEILHKEAGPLIHDEIKLLIPESGKTWRGKKPAAKKANSLMIDESENLAVTVKSRTSHNYLYFPDDGTNTTRHVGNQQFFLRGAENQEDEIIERCVGRLVDDFENII